MNSFENLIKCIFLIELVSASICLFIKLYLKNLNHFYIAFIFLTLSYLVYHFNAIFETLYFLFFTFHFRIIYIIFNKIHAYIKKYLCEKNNIAFTFHFRIIHIIFNKIHTYVKKYLYEKNNIKNSLDYKLIKLCLNNIEIYPKGYDIKENEYLKYFNNSKEEYINYLIDLLSFIKEYHFEQVPLYINLYGIIISSIPIFITINGNDTFTILYFVFITIICLISTMRLLSKTKTKQRLKFRNFEKYLKETLNNIN